jgi:hypothetical protein
VLLKQLCQNVVGALMHLDFAAIAKDANHNRKVHMLPFSILNIWQYK